MQSERNYDTVGDDVEEDEVVNQMIQNKRENQKKILRMMYQLEIQ
jgi:hypothetical protein